MRMVQAMVRYLADTLPLLQRMTAVASHGEEALKATLVQRFRAPGQGVTEG